MRFLDIAKKRYTTKVYQPKKISDEKIEELKEILRLAPSSINSQPWRFLFISDEKIRVGDPQHLNEDPGERFRSLSVVGDQPHEHIGALLPAQGGQLRAMLGTEQGPSVGVQGGYIDLDTVGARGDHHSRHFR